jgi:hypothetical protein
VSCLGRHSVSRFPSFNRHSALWSAINLLVFGFCIIYTQRVPLFHFISDTFLWKIYTFCAILPRIF